MADTEQDSTEDSTRQDIADQDIDGFFSTARVSGQAEAVTLPTDSYREFLFDRDDPVLAEWRGMSYDEFTAARQQNPFLRELLEYWNSLFAEPFVGVTSDGTVRDGLYRLPEAGASDPARREAAEALLAALSPDERATVSLPIDSPEWRGWSNPEFVFHRPGLRLENLTDDQVERVYALMAATLSPEGYARVREAMRLNGFLGELTELPTIMNERSYWFALYGTPSDTAPWGWQLSGHHCDVNFVTVAGRDVIAPVFIGGEPALSDDEHEPLFAAREATALALAASFTAEQRDAAVVYESVLDPAMPEGRLHPADERHVAGAFRDNRVVPYEGVNVTTFSAAQRALLREVVADFFVLLQRGQREQTLADYDAHLDETWLSWYGATDGSQPFYLRIQSPVILAELDHHAGVWLSNRLPARFHVHTTLRLPNGNDYAHAYLAEWQRQQQQHG